MLNSSTLIVASVLIAIVLAAIGLFRMARMAAQRAMSAERRAVELERELAHLKAQMATASSNATELSNQLSDLRLRLSKASSRADSFVKQFATLAGQAADSAAQIEQLKIQWRDEAQRAESRSARTEALSLKLDAIEAAQKAAEPAVQPPIDPERLHAMPEPELIALAESVAALRPLVPYPSWHFDIDWANPDLAFQTRRQVWQAFCDRGIQTPVVTGWHLGTRLKLHLGNDLSRQIYVAGCIDPNEFAFLDRYLEPGMTFFDLGANEGIYSVFAAARVGPSGAVWAFEPSPREFDRLQANLKLNITGGNDASNTRVLRLALADCNGYVDLNVAELPHAGQNTLGDFADASIETVSTPVVEARRLDDLLTDLPPGRIDIMKLDIEGAELRALKGAVATLRRYRPVLLFEVSSASLSHQGSSREGLLAFLRANEYSPYIFDPSGLPALAAPDAYSDNMLALPPGLALPPAVFQPWPQPARVHP